jgi:hypothetical protein
VKKKLKIHPIKPHVYRYIKLNNAVYEILGYVKVATNARVEVFGDQRHLALTDTDKNYENYCHALVTRHGVWTGNFFRPF